MLSGDIVFSRILIVVLPRSVSTGDTWFTHPAPFLIMTSLPETRQEFSVTLPDLYKGHPYVQYTPASFMSVWWCTVDKMEYRLEVNRYDPGGEGSFLLRFHCGSVAKDFKLCGKYPQTIKLSDGGNVFLFQLPIIGNM